MTTTYTPSDELVEAVLEAMISAVPYVPSLILKAIPPGSKKRGIAFALSRVIPLSLESIALTQRKGISIQLTENGALADGAKQSLIKKIAPWFVPDEVRTVTRELREDLGRMAAQGYETESVRLSIVNHEVVLDALNTSRIRQTTDTVIDLLPASLDAFKGAILKYMPRR